MHRPINGTVIELTMQLRKTRHAGNIVVVVCVMHAREIVCSTTEQQFHQRSKDGGCHSPVC